MSGHDPSSLDAGQYSEESIGKYERVYGRDFISPGGAQTAREFIAMLELKQGERVLDAGCGIGGAAFMMARDWGVLVEGVDLSINMIERARSRIEELGLGSRVSLSHGDLMALEAKAKFDAIYSRDVFLHVENKSALFSVLLTTLKPGGRVLITDYCRGDAPPSAEFTDYVRARGYFLLTIDGYAQLLSEAGFADVKSTDLTRRFAEIHAQELERMQKSGETGGALADVAAGWRQKRERALKGEQRWALFTGRRAV